MFEDSLPERRIRVWPHLEHDVLYSVWFEAHKEDVERCVSDLDRVFVVVYVFGVWFEAYNFISESELYDNLYSRAGRDRC